MITVEKTAIAPEQTTLPEAEQFLHCSIQTTMESFCKELNKLNPKLKIKLGDAFHTALMNVANMFTHEIDTAKYPHFIKIMLQSNAIPSGLTFYVTVQKKKDAANIKRLLVSDDGDFKKGKIFKPGTLFPEGFILNASTEK